MKTTLQKMFYHFHLKNNENNISFLLYSTIFIICSNLVVYYSSFYWLFEATLKDLKSWYPNFYLVFYFFLKSLFLFSILILGIQLRLLFYKLRIKFIFFIPALSLLVISSVLMIESLWLFSFIIFIIYSFYKTNQTLRLSKESFLSYFDKWLLFGIILTAFIIRLIWIYFTDNSWNGDASSRLFIADSWINSIKEVGFQNKLFNVHLFMPSIDWLPLHFYLVGIISSLFGDWEYAPRILTAVFAALSLIPLYKLSLLKFDRITAILATLILTFYGYHVLLSSMILSEVLYIFFVLYAYYFIEKWSVSNNKKVLFQLAFTLVCLGLLRFEGWIFSGVCIFLLPFIKKIKPSYVLFVIIVLLPIVFVMFGELMNGEHPLRGILYSDLEVKITLSNEPLTVKNIFKEYQNSLIPLAFFSLLIMGIVYFKEKNRRIIMLYILYILPFIPFAYKSIDGSLTAQARYMTLYMVPFIPFVAFLFSKLWYSILKWQFVMLFSFYILLFNAPMYNNIIKGSKSLLKYDEGFHESVNYVKRIEKGFFYVDNEKEYGSGNWIVLCRLNNHGINLHQIKKLGLKYSIGDYYEKYNKSVVSFVDSDSDVEEVWDDKIFDELLDLDAITHVMLFPEGKLSHKLNFTNYRESYKGKDFIRQFNKNGYRVYQLVNPKGISLIQK